MLHTIRHKLLIRGKLCIASTYIHTNLYVLKIQVCYIRIPYLLFYALTWLSLLLSLIHMYHLNNKFIITLLITNKWVLVKLKFHCFNYVHLICTRSLVLWKDISITRQRTYFCFIFAINHIHKKMSYRVVYYCIYIHIHNNHKWSWMYITTQLVNLCIYVAIVMYEFKFKTNNIKLIFKKP